MGEEKAAQGSKGLDAMIILHEVSLKRKYVNFSELFSFFITDKNTQIIIFL